MEEIGKKSAGQYFKEMTILVKSVELLEYI